MTCLTAAFHTNNSTIERYFTSPVYNTDLQSGFSMTVIVDVDGWRVLDGLGGHVVERSDLGLLDDAGVVALDGVGNAEVDQLQAGLDEDEISRLEVAVNYACDVMGKNHYNNIRYPATLWPVYSIQFRVYLTQLQANLILYLAYFQDLLPADMQSSETSFNLVFAKFISAQYNFDRFNYPVCGCHPLLPTFLASRPRWSWGTSINPTIRKFNQNQG